MKMNSLMTHHATKRGRQRGITLDVLDCLMKHGKPNYAAEGATRVSLSRRDANKIISELKEKINIIEKASGKCLIEKDGMILTVYHKI